MQLNQLTVHTPTSQKLPVPRMMIYSQMSRFIRQSKKLCSLFAHYQKPKPKLLRCLDSGVSYPEQQLLNYLNKINEPDFDANELQLQVFLKRNMHHLNPCLNDAFVFQLLRLWWKVIFSKWFNYVHTSCSHVRFTLRNTVFLK